MADDAAHEDSHVVLVDVGHDIIGGRQELEVAHFQARLLEQFALGACFEGLAKLEMASWKSPFSWSHQLEIPLKEKLLQTELKSMTHRHRYSPFAPRG